MYFKSLFSVCKSSPKVNAPLKWLHSEKFNHMSSTLVFPESNDPEKDSKQVPLRSDFILRLIKIQENKNRNQAKLVPLMLNADISILTTNMFTLVGVLAC